MMDKFIVNVIRSNNVECSHVGNIAVFKDDELIYSVGDTECIVSWRSTAKPFLLLPLIIKIKEKYNLTDKELAIMSSSHNGEKEHRDVIKGLLDKINATEENLNSGAHLPYYEWLFEEYFSEVNPYKKQLFHNCSGKHVAMLMMCKLYGFPIEGYWEKSHPVQVLIADSFKEFIEISGEEYFDIGLDGCGVPNYFTSLKKMAFAYQKFSSSEEVSILRNAILNEPYMIAGKERIDTDIIKECKFIGKSGSEGLFCISIPSMNMGIALKIESGSDDAAEASIVALLNKLRLLSEHQKGMLSKYENLKIYTSTNVLSGHYEVILD